MAFHGTGAYARSMAARSSVAHSASAQSQGSALDSVFEIREALKGGLAPLGATNLAVFGSVARREESEDSDIDLLVDLDANVGLFAMLRMRSLAEQLLGRSVDIVPRVGLKADIAEVVLREAIAL